MTGALAVICAAVLFGTTGTAQALGPDGTTPLGVGTLRIAVGAVALWVIARRRPRRPVRTDVGWLALGAVGVAGYQPTFFTGTDRAGVALGTIVALGSGPAFAGLLDVVLFRRRPAPSWLAATTVALSGGALLVAAQGGAVRLDALGVTAALGAGLSYAGYAVATKVLIGRGWNSTTALATQFSLGALVLIPFLAGQPLGWVATGSGLLMLAHLGVVTVGVAYWLYGIGLRTLPTSTAVLLTLAEPVTAAGAAVVVLDEHLPPLGWLGAALVVAGLALGATRRRALPPEA
ncbi:MAG: DMT family transporter [Desertimonas sp.]